MSIEYPFTFNAHVIRTGAAREGREGDSNDTVTITITAISYKFEVVLPAVARSLGNLSVDVLPNGNVKVEGIVRAGERTSSTAPTVCNRRTRRIFPLGHFTINFTLPGPADNTIVRAKLDSNGVLKGTAFKRWIGFHTLDPILTFDDKIKMEATLFSLLQSDRTFRWPLVPAPLQDHQLSTRKQEIDEYINSFVISSCLIDILKTVKETLDHPGWHNAMLES